MRESVCTVRKLTMRDRLEKRGEETKNKEWLKGGKGGTVSLRIRNYRLDK